MTLSFLFQSERETHCSYLVEFLCLGFCVRGLVLKPNPRENAQHATRAIHLAEKKISHNEDPENEQISHRLRLWDRNVE